MKLHIGCSGFHYVHWKGKFYPQTLPPGKWLEYYCNTFSTVEINVSFYRFPTEHMVQSWKTTATSVNNGFVFTFKGNRLITHLKRLQLSPELESSISRFVALFDMLQTNKGCILWQLHQSMKCNDTNLLKLEDFCRYLTKLPCRFVIEFRDPGWWNKKVFSILEEANVAFCVESGLGLPDAMVVTAEFAYIRFHGPADNYSSNYTDQQLIAWKKTIEEYCDKCSDIYCYFNNDVSAYAVSNAQRLRELMGNSISPVD
ncbi:MAG TPA: DUF72 domain-containing protein [Chitinispirillaceae bacterium]|nr:DUF72 domain-containing protein [Chitinispirillaceae bacterium]